MTLRFPERSSLSQEGRKMADVEDPFKDQNKFPTFPVAASQSPIVNPFDPINEESAKSSKIQEHEKRITELENKVTALESKSSVTAASAPPQGEPEHAKILREHGGLESNIPVNHHYWRIRP